MNRLEEKIDYTFKSQDLLQLSLTHSSTGSEYNYERLEFLGDRVLGLVVAHMIFETFPEEKEGDLAKRHAALVQGKMLAKVARDINLGEIIQLSEAERNAGGADNDNILADSLESIIGALYLDGGLDASKKVITALWQNYIHVMTEPPQDPKTALQEWAQARSLNLPAYEITSREGPDHAPLFEITVSLDGHGSEKATGTSRRKAEKKAAEKMLARLHD